MAGVAGKSGSGGARPGAGRKPTREKFATQVARAEKKIADKLPSIVDKMIELAEGVTLQEVNANTGEKSIYEKAPDFRAQQYLLDRIMGKPITHVEAEVGGHGGGAFVVAFQDSVIKAYGDSGSEEFGQSDAGDEAGG